MPGYQHYYYHECEDERRLPLEDWKVYRDAAGDATRRMLIKPCKADGHETFSEIQIPLITISAVQLDGTMLLENVAFPTTAYVRDIRARTQLDIDISVESLTTTTGQLLVDSVLVHDSGLQDGDVVTVVLGDRVGRVRLGMRVMVNNAGSQAVNGIYEAVENPSCSKLRFGGEIRFVHCVNTVYSLVWYPQSNIEEESDEWPAAWYIEAAPDYTAIYIRAWDTEGLLPLGGWEIPTLDAYCEAGQAPPPCIEVLDA